MLLVRVAAPKLQQRSAMLESLSTFSGDSRAIFDSAEGGKTILWALLPKYTAGKSKVVPISLPLRALTFCGQQGGAAGVFLGPVLLLKSVWSCCGQLWEQGSDALQEATQHSVGSTWGTCVSFPSPAPGCTGRHFWRRKTGSRYLFFWPVSFILHTLYPLLAQIF